MVAIVDGIELRIVMATMSMMVSTTTMIFVHVSDSDTEIEDNNMSVVLFFLWYGCELQ